VSDDITFPFAAILAAHDNVDQRLDLRRHLAMECHGRHGQGAGICVVCVKHEIGGCGEFADCGLSAVEP
jgi:hypothetical protein